MDGMGFILKLSCWNSRLCPLFLGSATLSLPVPIEMSDSLSKINKYDETWTYSANFIMELLLAASVGTMQAVLSGMFFDKLDVFRCLIGSRNEFQFNTSDRPCPSSSSITPQWISHQPIQQSKNHSPSLGKNSPESEWRGEMWEGKYLPFKHCTYLRQFQQTPGTDPSYPKIHNVQGFPTENTC